MDRKTKYKNKSMLKLVAVFMIIVLIVGVVPVNAYAESVGTYTHKYRFRNMNSEEDETIVREAAEQIYAYDPVNDKIYNYVKVGFEWNEFVEENVWYIETEDIPKGIRVYLYAKYNAWETGSVCIEDEFHTGVSISTELDYVYVKDGEEILDVAYGAGYLVLSDEKLEIPKKSGYVFKEWVDLDGDPIVFPKGHLEDNTIYASWELHQHNWDVNTWESDEIAHWHNCVGEGTCDIIENDEKDGYATHIFKHEWEYDDKVHYHICETCEMHNEDILHEMGEWVEVTAATFNEDGKEERKCTSCEYEEERIIAKLSESHIHDFSGEEEFLEEPTCTKEGLKRVYCTEVECGEYKEESIEKKDHEYKDEWECNTEFHYHTCKNCGMHDEDKLHEMGEWVEVTAATFYEEGKEERKCTSCEYKEERRIAKLSESHIHDFSGEEEIIEESTCTKEGLKKVYCTEVECGEYREESIEKKDHEYKDEWEYNNEFHYHTCKNCGMHDEYILHEMGEWVEVTAATFYEEGKEERKCTSCEYKEERKIAKLSESHIHDFTGKEEILKAPTCVEKGLIKVFCSEEQCGASIEKTILEADHIYGSEWEYDGEFHYQICEFCGKRSDENEHQMGEGVVVKEATEQEDGLIEWKCTQCEYSTNGILKYIAPELPEEEQPKEEQQVEEQPEEKIPEEKIPEEKIPEEKLPEEIVVEQEVQKEAMPAPYTGDDSPVEMYATMAMIAGFAYILSMFTGDLLGMSEETKEDIIKKLVRWGKANNIIIKGIAIIGIFFVLSYYHGVGKKIDKNEYFAAR